MSILLSNEITEAIRKELNSAKDSVQVITAYCKQNAITNIDGYIGDSVHDRKLMVRFRKDDLVKGSSDLSAAKYCLQNGWKVFVRFDLHAKTYIVDNKRGIVTSANATNSGLGYSQRSNMEVGTLVDVEREDLTKIAGLYSDAIELDDLLLSKMEKQLAELQPNGNMSSQEWSSDITELFHPEIKTLFSHEIPGDAVSAEGYVEFLDQDFGGDLNALKNAFRWSNAYLWLLSTLKANNNCMYFGALTAKLHDALVVDPKPYRKDVKIHLANLLSMVDKLQMDEVMIDIPNHSQRIRLVR